ncbi:MAG: hypothetical protein EAZ92_15445 [Candidatus Kapaibacterium sp.]|nr:MAG: hypothetical protein EAZ92_15445 [Candidatus Kapabacteria bacterium]
MSHSTPSSSNFTREQRIAQSADRHLAVTAGAGAGKTSVLVQRYLHLLFSPHILANVRDIVAITFTRKAAAEMKQRIAEEIEKKLADESKRAHWGRYKFVRERFSGARISTIHSYCAQLLREFPIEAGVNPNFVEIEEYDLALLKEQAINEVLEAWLEEEQPKKKKQKAIKTSTDAPSAPTTNDQATNDQATNDQVTNNQEPETSRQIKARRVWTFFGKQNIFAILSTLLANRERFNSVQKVYENASNDALLKKCEQIFLTRMYTGAEEYCIALDNAMTALNLETMSPATRLRFEALSSAVGIFRKQTREALQQLDSGNDVSIQAHRTWQNAVEWSQMLVLATQGEKTCTQYGNISGIYTKSEKYFHDKETFLRWNEEARGSFARLGPLLGVIEQHDDDRVVMEISRILMDIADDAWGLVQEEKDRIGGLDFDDLQLKADELLENPDVCLAIRSNTRFLMIDEFQDTDELQYRIARKIIGVLGENILAEVDAMRASTASSASSSSTNFFIVGDPKQSIYRFRGADVRVFTKAKRDIERYNSILLKHNALSTTFAAPDEEIPAETQHNSETEHSTEAAGVIGLRATFRLLPEIAAFVNVVSGDQFRRGTTEFDVEYDDIICGAGASTVRGSVTMLLPRYEKGEQQKNSPLEEFSTTEFDEQTAEASIDEASNKVSEARLLAEYIRSIAGNDASEPVMVRSSSGVRPATYSDVMILVRSRTGTDALLAALRRAEVPFLLNAGRGFYGQQEIVDIRSFLLFLQNTNDDIALAAVLRSPFFALSDTELYRISRAEVDVSAETSSNALWQRFHAYSTSDQQSDNARRAYQILSRLLPLAAQLSIPTLIRSILEQTSWRAMLAADERFEQIEANLEKLLGIARRYENRGFRNLYDFAEELRRLAHYALSESEADTETGKNAVRIMTIHGAKGLEAPIVALFNTNAGASSGGVSLSFDAELGMSFTMLRSREDGTVMQYKTPLHLMASQQDALAEEAELKRLLYVALTRAKDHLIISGKCEQKKDGTMSVPKGFLRMIIESLNAEELNLLNEPYIPLPKHDLTLLESNTTRKTAVEYQMPIIRALEQLPRPKAASELASHKELECEKEETSSKQTSRTPLPALLLGTLDTIIEGDVYSASQLHVFERNILEYQHLYRLGLPPADSDGVIIGRGAGINDEADDTIGASAGTCIHAVLEHLPLWYTPEGTVMGQEYQRTLDRVLPSRVAFISPALLARIQRETQAIAATPLLKRFSALLNAAHFEYSVQMPIDADFLIGSFDVLIQNPQGDWEVWDWKTNQAKTSRDMEELVREYRLQLEVYAFLLAHLFPEQNVFRTRLLFSQIATSVTKDEEWTRVLEFTRSDIDGIEKKIRRLIGEIRAQSYGLA